MRATKHFQYGLLDPQRKEKKIKLFTGKAPNKKEEELEIFLGFHLITTTSMENKLTNLLIFLKVYQTHKKKSRKRN